MLNNKESGADSDRAAAFKTHGWTVLAPWDLFGIRDRRILKLYRGCRWYVGKIGV